MAEGADVLVFKRPARGKTAAGQANQLLMELALRANPDNTTLLPQVLAGAADQASRSPRVEPRVLQKRKLEAEIALLQKRLDDLRAADRRAAVFAAADLGPKADLGKLMTVLVSLADVRYGEEGRKQRLSFSHSRDGLKVEGDPDAVDWVVEVVGKLKPAGPKQ
jgi:hypothetical protein